MKDLISSANNLDKKFIKFLIVGESGIGKTTLSKTFPHKEVLLLSFEGGELSVSDTDIAVIKFNDLTNPQDRYKRLLDVWSELQKPEYKQQFKYVVIDSLTELSNLIKESVFMKFTDPKMTMLAWGKYNDLIKDIIKKFRDIDYNVVFLALPKVEKDDVGRRFTNINMMGSIKDEVAGYFDEVFHYQYLKDSKRMLVTAGDGTFEAKDRSNKLEKFEEPNLGQILTKIKAKKK
jgi:hypothetical protein